METPNTLISIEINIIRDLRKTLCYLGNHYILV